MWYDSMGRPALETDEIEIMPKMIETGPQVMWSALDEMAVYGCSAGRD